VPAHNRAACNGKLGRVRRVDELADLVGWTGTASAELSWQDVAGSPRLQYPAAYRELLDVFPSGEFADGIRMISPVQDTGTLELFRTNAENWYFYFTHVRDIAPETFPHRFHPEFDGLILWATDDEHCYFWDPSSDRDPDTWPIVFLQNTGPSWGAYDGSAVDFLFDVITGNFQHEALYSDWEDAPKTFYPTRFMGH
jgi:hypothetical protein